LPEQLEEIMYEQGSCILDGFGSFATMGLFKN